MRILLLSACVCSLLAGAALAQTPPTTTANPPAVQCVGAEGVVYFDTGSIALGADSNTALLGLSTARHPECATQVTVTGHTDSTGSLRRNRQLAQQRATAVQQHLVSLGVPLDEIAIGGAGESAPQSTTEDGLNRRVTIVLTASPRVPLAQPAAVTNANPN